MKRGSHFYGGIRVASINFLNFVNTDRLKNKILGVITLNTTG